MSHRTGLWFQAARGRAMVRNRSMRLARIWKERRIQAERGAGMVWRDPQWCHEQTVHFVRRARAAHREWRKYREWDAVYRALT